MLSGQSRVQGRMDPSAAVGWPSVGDWRFCSAPGLAPVRSVVWNSLPEAMFLNHWKNLVVKRPHLLSTYYMQTRDFVLHVLFPFTLHCPPLRVGTDTPFHR